MCTGIEFLVDGTETDKYLEISDGLARFVLVECNDQWLNCKMRSGKVPLEADSGAADGPEQGMVGAKFTALRGWVWAVAT